MIYGLLVRPLFNDLFFISAHMHFYCHIYFFPIITDLAIIYVNMQIEGNFAHAQLRFQDGRTDTVPRVL